MFSNKNKTKLTKIVFTSIAFISFVITIGIIVNNKTYDLPQKRVNNAPIESSVKRKPKIFCVITTRAENHDLKAVHVKNTWAKRCDRFIFLSSEHNEDLPAIKVCNEEDRNHLWCKTKNGLQYIHDQFGDDFDWFLKADDDSYIIVDNLRHFLSNYSPESPLYFGCKFQLNDVVYMSGGAGYVLSRQSLKRFIQRLSVNSTDDQSCRADTDIGAEDVELGRCLRSAGVVAGDSRDESAKPRFFPFDPLKVVSPATDLDRLAPWFSNYSVYHHKTGPDCCSRTVISFHYVSRDVMYLMDFLLYGVKVEE